MSDVWNLPLSHEERGPGGEVVTLTRATEADVAALVSLYDEASAWLMARGSRQWPPGWWTPAVVVKELRAGHEMYLARRDGEPVGKLTLQWDDTEVWGEQPPDAAYIHGLCVSRVVAGRELGVALLGWASQRARANGRSLLRLDCMAANPRLRAYYEGLGFVYRGIGDEGWAALYERPA